LQDQVHSSCIKHHKPSSSFIPISRSFFFALNTDLNINKIKKHLVFIKQPITSKKSVVDRYIVVMLNT